MKKYNSRIIAAILFALCLGILSGCSYTTDPGFDYLTPTGTPTPSPTATPSPTPSPSPAPTATITPTPLPDMSFTNGNNNACAQWDGNDMTPAKVEPGALIYLNNMEKDAGCTYPSVNAYSCDQSHNSDTVYDGNYSLMISNRKESTHGISGTGFSLSKRNGLRFTDLIGHTVEMHCFIYYNDELFGVQDELTFALYDTYHTERVMGYTYNKNNDIITDENGEPVLKEQDAFPILDTAQVKVGEWTHVTFTFTVEDSEVSPEDGMFLIATKDEASNSLGLYVSYYLDDVSMRVIE